MTFSIRFQDRWLCAIDKPAGLMVHRSTLGSDRQFALQMLRDQIGRRVWPVHRLDRATSGVLLFALDRETAAALGRQFMAHAVDKRYLAVARGWTDDKGTIDHPLPRRRGESKRPARTRYRTLARCELPVALEPHDSVRYSLVEVRPESGRMHQIRRHFKHISHHLIGDTTYGDGRHNRVFRQHLGCHRLLLHASRLALDHPWEGRPLQLVAPLETEFARLAAEAFGWTEQRSGVTDQGSG